MKYFIISFGLISACISVCTESGSSSTRKFQHLQFDIPDKKWFQEGYTFVPLVTKEENDQSRIRVKASLKRIYNLYVWYLLPLQIVTRGLAYGLRKAGFMNQRIVPIEDKIALYNYIAHRQKERALWLVQQYRDLKKGSRQVEHLSDLIKNMKEPTHVTEQMQDRFSKMMYYNRHLIKLHDIITHDVFNKGKAYVSLAYQEAGNKWILKIIEKQERQCNEYADQVINITKDSQKTQESIFGLQETLENNSADTTPELCQAFINARNDLKGQYSELASSLQKKSNICRQAACDITDICNSLEKKDFGTCKLLLQGQFKEEELNNFITLLGTLVKKNDSVDRQSVLQAYETWFYNLQNLRQDNDEQDDDESAEELERKTDQKEKEKEKI